MSANDANIVAQLYANIENAIENDFVYEATALVKGFDTTYSIDCKDAAGNKVSGSPAYVEKGKAVF